MKEKTLVIPMDDGDITISTGKMAYLSPGSVFVSKGGTTVFVAATPDSKDSDRDFFPLTVEYLEKMYAWGTISGSRVNKREGFPSKRAILAARQVDHTIRPLFPKSFKRPVNVIINVMAYDRINNPEQLAVFGASLAILLSGIPFSGPVSSVIAGVDADENVMFNPTMDHDHSDMLGEFIVAAKDDTVLNIEGWGKELSEDKMDEIMDKSMELIRKLNKAQLEFVSDLDIKEIEYTASELSEELVEQVKSAAWSDLEKVLYNADKVERDQDVAQLISKVAEEMIDDESEFSEGQIAEAMDHLSKKMLRANVIENERRLSGRGLKEIRDLTADVDLLPTVHGSALFGRGLTQSLSITTLGPVGRGNILNDMTGIDDIEQFMHHYAFPPYSVGDAGRVRYKPGRREIGHGEIGQNALKHMFPEVEDFPYSVRVVSEIMSSNGSTSMAATCAASMALMAAGVPMKKAVAGIGVGLVTADETQDQYKLLLDIEGVEDFFGDMDFKVTGTDEGVTAIQFETKLKGVKPEILKEAFRLSRDGRMQVLEVMNSAISESRAETSPTAPKVTSVKINPEFIGAIIGPGGKNIKELVEEGNKLGIGELEVDINDDGTVFITASNQAQVDYAVSHIKSVAFEPEIGEEYEGVVESVMPYGAFVGLGGSSSGLVHVSEMSNEYVKDPSSIVKEGQKVKVKVIGMERGKLSLSMKQVSE